MKKSDKNATIKQKRVFKEIVENHGSISQAMIKCGYSKATAKNPQNLTNSLGWKRLIEQYLPNDLLGQRHSEGLGATKHEQRMVGRDGEGRPLYEYEEVTDFAARYKYLVTAYKIKGMFPKESEINNNVLIQFRRY